MNLGLLLSLTNKSIEVLDEYINKYSISTSHTLNKDVRRILMLLNNELKSNHSQINTRILRAFKDITTLIAVQYEDTMINEPIFNLYNSLEIEITGFKELDLLRMDFDKSDPV